MQGTNNANKNAAAIRSIVVGRKKLVGDKVFDELVGDALYVSQLPSEGIGYQRVFKVEGKCLSGEIEIYLQGDSFCNVHPMNRVNEVAHTIKPGVVDHEDFMDLGDSATYIVGQVMVAMAHQFSQSLGMCEQDVDCFIEVTKPKGQTRTEVGVSVNFSNPVIEKLSNVAIDNLNREGLRQAYLGLSRGELEGSLIGEVVVGGDVKTVHGEWKLSK